LKEVNERAWRVLKNGSGHQRILMNREMFHAVKEFPEQLYLTPDGGITKARHQGHSPGLYQALTRLSSDSLSISDKGKSDHFVEI